MVILVRKAEPLAGLAFLKTIGRVRHPLIVFFDPQQMKVSQQ
jgi:hypothetical protein